MAELSLTEVFGAGATQTATTITIAKSDLVGLTANSSNTADSLAVGILNRLTTAYPRTARDANKDISLVANLSPIPSVEGDFSVIPNTAYLVSNYQVGVYSPYSSSTPNPNDY